MGQDQDPPLHPRRSIPEGPYAAQPPWSQEMFPSLPEARSGGGPRDQPGITGNFWEGPGSGGTWGALEALTVPSRERQRPRCRQRPQSTFLNLESQVHLNQQGKGPRSCPETPGSDRRVWLQNDLNHGFLFCSQCGSWSSTKCVFRECGNSSHLLDPRTEPTMILSVGAGGGGGSF